MIISLVVLMFQAASPTAGTQTARAVDEKTVCRRHAETGSFVRRSKTCRKKSEWRRIEQDAQETGRGMQTQMATERGG